MNYFTQDELNQAVNAAVEATKIKMYEVIRETFYKYGYDEMDSYIEELDKAFNEHVSSGI